MFSLEDETFQVFGICSLLLLAKMTFMSLLTSRQRIKTGKFANKEDSYFGDKSAPANLKESLKANDEVERVRRAHMNDMENIYPFILIGFFYCLTGPNSNTAKFHFITFLMARVLHTIVYIAWHAACESSYTRSATARCAWRRRSPSSSSLHLFRWK